MENNSSFRFMLVTVVLMFAIIFGMGLSAQVFAASTTPPRPEVSGSKIPASVPAPQPQILPAKPGVTTPVKQPTPKAPVVKQVAKNAAGFNPLIQISTISPREDQSTKLSFHNGIFVDDPNGGVYVVCGSVKHAQDLEVDNRSKSFIEIDGNRFPLQTTPPAVNGDYTFCGNVNIKNQFRDLPADITKHATLSNIFNNFQVDLRNNKGETASERYTIVNSLSRDTLDTNHDDEMELLLNNQGASGDRINDYLSHAVNDFILSNESLFEDKAEAGYNKTTGNSCNLESIYNNIQDDKGLWSQFLMEIFEITYGITHDIDGDETMMLCFESLSIGDSQLSVTTGNDADSMFKISGSLKNVQIRLAFKHYSNGFFSGYTPLEQGTLVLNLGTITTRAYVQNLDLSEGHFTGNMTVDYVSMASFNSWWENWETTDVWYETADSGMDELDNKLDSKMANGFYKDDMEDTEIDNEIANQDMAILFDPSSSLFALVIENLDVELPSLITNAYSKQHDYRSTDNDGTFEVYQNHEMSFALDDDLINHQLHLADKEGKFEQTQIKTQEDGSTMTITFKAPVAPVVTFDGEENYALRMDIANASLVLLSSKSPVAMEYRVDLSTVLAMYSNGSGKLVNFVLEDSAIHLVSLKGPKAPDKLLESVMKTAINKILTKMEDTVNAKLTDKVDQVFSSMPVDVCTDVDGTGANGSGDYLAGSVDLGWTSSISRTDSCFKIIENQSSGNSSYDTSCIDEYGEDLCDDELPTGNPYDTGDYYETETVTNDYY